MSVEIKGLEELRVKISDPNLIGRPVTTMLKEAALIGRDAAVEGISGGTGRAERTISRQVKAREMTAKVYTVMAEERAMSIEVGRQPGEIVPIRAIERWAVAVGNPDPPRVIQRRIQKRGVKGKFYMRGAREAVEKDMPRLVRDMAKQVEERLK